MEIRRSYQAAFSPIQITAALSILVLLGVAGWRGYDTYQGELVATPQPTPAPATTAPTIPDVPGSTAIGAAVLEDLVSRYNTLQEQGIYTPEIGQKVAEEMASALVPDVPFLERTKADLTIDPTTSSDRTIAYRRDLQDSLRPLLENKQAEFEIFAYYTDTKDEKYLEQLQSAARNYRAAAKASANISVPQDAVTVHLAIVNALERFAATLEAQVANAHDPLASAALLRTYTQSEEDVMTSFNSLATYFKQKIS